MRPDLVISADTSAVEVSHTCYCNHGVLVRFSILQTIVFVSELLDACLGVTALVDSRIPVLSGRDGFEVRDAAFVVIRHLASFLLRSIALAV